MAEEHFHHPGPAASSSCLNQGDQIQSVLLKSKGHILCLSPLTPRQTLGCLEGMRRLWGFSQALPER